MPTAAIARPIFAVRGKCTRFRSQFSLNSQDWIVDLTHSRLYAGRRQLHFYKRRLCCFPQSSLPVNKLGLSQFPILAKRRYTLPALLLLGYQNPPLRPGLLSALIHAPSLPQSALADKMWFRYRSHFSGYNLEERVRLCQQEEDLWAFCFPTLMLLLPNVDE